MDHLNGLVLRIEEGVKTLQSELNQTKTQLSEKEKEVHSLQLALEEAKNRLAQMEETNSTLRMAKAIGRSTGDSGAARKKMNELVREIDKCIAMLNG